MGRDKDGKANVRQERNPIVTALVIGLTTFACLGLVFGIYLWGETLIRYGALGALFGENAGATEIAIGRAIIAVSFVALGAALALTIVWSVFTRGFFSPFTETQAEKLAEVAFIVVSVPLLVLLWGSPWLPAVLAALFFIFVGARLWMRPQDAAWRKGERSAYITFTGIALFLLVMQIVQMRLLGS